MITPPRAFQFDPEANRGLRFMRHLAQTGRLDGDTRPCTDLDNLGPVFKRRALFVRWLIANGRLSDWR